MPGRAGLVTALILGRALCEACIAERTTMSAADVAATVMAIGAVVRIHRAIDRCRACGETKTVLVVARPAN